MSVAERLLLDGGRELGFGRLLGSPGLAWALVCTTFFTHTARGTKRGGGREGRLQARNLHGDPRECFYGRTDVQALPNPQVEPRNPCHGAQPAFLRARRLALPYLGWPTVLKLTSWGAV